MPIISKGFLEEHLPGSSGSGKSASRGPLTSLDNWKDEEDAERNLERSSPVEFPWNTEWEFILIH